MKRTIAIVLVSALSMSGSGWAQTPAAPVAPVTASVSKAQLDAAQAEVLAAQQAGDANAVLRASRRLLEFCPNEPIAQSVIYQAMATAAAQAGRTREAVVFGGAAMALDPAAGERTNVQTATRGDKGDKMLAALTVMAATVSAVQQARAAYRQQAPAMPGGQMAPPGMGGQMAPPGMGGQMAPPGMGGQMAPPGMGGQMAPPGMGGGPAYPPQQYAMPAGYPPNPVGAPGYQQPQYPQPYPGYGPPAGQPQVWQYMMQPPPAQQAQYAQPYPAYGQTPAPPPSQPQPGQYYPQPQPPPPPPSAPGVMPPPAAPPAPYLPPAAPAPPPQAAGYNTGALEGFDHNKLNNPAHQTIKYQFARIAQKYAPTQEGFAQLMADPEFATLGAQPTGNGKIRLSNGEVIDVVRGFAEGGRAWQWAPEESGGGPVDVSIMPALPPGQEPYPAPPGFAAGATRGAAFAPIKVRHDHSLFGDDAVFGATSCGALVAIDGGNLTLTPGGAEGALVIPALEIIEIRLGTVVGTSVGAFHILTKRGLYLHLAPATGRAEDGRAVVDALRRGLNLQGS